MYLLLCCSDKAAAQRAFFRNHKPKCLRAWKLCALPKITTLKKMRIKIGREENKSSALVQETSSLASREGCVRSEGWTGRWAEAKGSRLLPCQTRDVSSDETQRQVHCASRGSCWCCSPLRPAHTITKSLSFSEQTCFFYAIFM